MFSYPIEIVNGTLKKPTTDIESVESKIRQTLGIVRGELIANPYFGVPFQIFSSTLDFGADVSRLEQILQSEIPEAEFRCSYEILSIGTFSLQIRWSYKNTENTLQYELKI